MVWEFNIPKQPSIRVLLQGTKGPQIGSADARKKTAYSWPNILVYENIWQFTKKYLSVLQ